jgi:hypothetical protein
MYTITANAESGSDRMRETTADVPRRNATPHAGFQAGPRREMAEMCHGACVCVFPMCTLGIP